MTEKPKVIIVGPNLEFGGVTRYLKDFAKRARLCKVIIFNTARPKKNKIRPSAGYNEAFNSGLIRSFAGLSITIWHMIKFPFSIIHSKASLVHICGVSYFPFWENSWYILVAKIFSKPVTLHYLGAFDQYYDNVGPFQQSMIRSVLKMPDRIFLLSDKVRVLIESFIDPSMLLVLPSSVDTDWFSSPSREFAESSIGIDLLFIGGLDPFRKGIYDLLEAFSKILPQFPKANLVLTGGESFKEVRSRWEKMGIQNNIDFRGWVNDNDMPTLYSSCDLLLLPSYNEGLPYVIIEALSSGLPIIASDVGGIGEVLADNINGLIVQPGDIEAITTSLIKLLSSKALRTKMSVNNREKAEESYSVGKIIESIEAVFHSLLIEN